MKVPLLASQRVRALSRRASARCRHAAILELLEPRMLLSTTLISSATDGSAAGNADLLLPGAAINVSPDGRFALFTSASTNLVAGITDTNGAADIFLRDFQNNTTSIISVDAGGTALGSLKLSNLIFSPDSHYLLFTSNSANMVASVSDTNTVTDLFVRNLLTGTTSVVSINAAGTSTGNHGVTGKPVFSPDSRYVAFTCQATDLVNGLADTTGEDVFLRDLQTSTTSVVSISASGTATGESVSDGPLVFSPDGRYLAFNSEATNLVAGITNISDTNLYVRDRQTDTTYIVTRDLDNNATGWAATSDPFSYQFTPDSQNFIYTTSGANIVTGVTDSTGRNQIYDWNASSNSISMISENAAGTAAGDHVSDPMGLSPDGRYFAFTSASTNLTPQSAGGDVKADLYVRDMQTNTTTYVAVNATASVAFPAPTFSPDSTYLLFQSDATNVVPGLSDTNGNTDLFLYNLHTSAITAATVNQAGTATANTQSFGIDDPLFSPNGRYLAFSSDATDLAPGVTSNHNLMNLFVRDLQTGTTVLATASFNNTDAGYNPNTMQALFTSDSNFLVFDDDGIVANSITTFQNFIFNHVNLYAIDLGTDTRYLLGANAAATSPSNGTVSEFVIDPAADSTLFVSTSSDMVSGVTDTTSNQPSYQDVFLATIPPTIASGAAVAGVTGLGNAIASGDSTPSATDGTDFGSTPVGTTVSRTFTVTNSGTADLTTSNLMLPSGYTLTEPLAASIAAGQNDSFTVRFDASDAGASPGTISFTTNDTTSSNYSFAITATAAAVAANAPDLVIEGGVTQVKLGTFIGGTKGGKASVKVFNRGDASATGTIQVTFFASADGTLDGSDKALVTVNHKATLKVGKNLVFTGMFSYPLGIADGPYFILAEVDPSNTIAESNESNNVASSPATIGIQAPFVDLSGVSLTPIGKLTAGKHGSVALVVQNSGNVKATGKITFQLVASTDDTLGNGDDILLPPLAKPITINPNATKRIVLGTALTSVLAGSYHLFAVIDSTDVLTESNEANNSIETATLVSVL